MTDLALRILLQAQDSASAIVKNLGGVLSQLGGGALGGVATIAGTAAIAVAGFGVASVKAAGDFQQGMTTLVTGAGESQKNLKLVSDGILNLSVATGTSTKQLTDGMYMIESAGYHGADGLNVLKIASEGAKVGNADLGVTANALTTILTDYHMSSSQAAGAMNALTTTVASGKTHLQDLAGAMGSVLPLASSLGVSLPQVTGAIATMTNAGMSAQRASMNLANAIRSLAAPNATAQKAMKEVGLTAQELKNTLSTQGLTGAIQLIEEHVGKKFPAGSVEGVQAFKALMGGATGYNVALMLGGKNMEGFKGNVDAISKSLNAGGQSVQGWSLVQQDFNFKMEQAQQAVNVLMIKVGTLLLPVVTQLASALLPLITNFTNWATSSTTVSSVMSGFNAVMAVVNTVVRQAGAILVPMLVQAWTSLQQSLAPIMPELRIFAQVVGVIVVASIMQFAKVFGGLVQILGGAIQVLANLIAFFVDLFTGNFKKLGPDLQGIWNGIVQMLRGLVNALAGSMFSWGQNIINGFVNGILSMLGSVGNAVSQVAGKVGAFLGFHSPAKEGPGADADVWGPNLVKTFSSGMVSALPTLNAAVSMTAGQLSPLASPAKAAGGGSSGSGNVFNITIQTGYLKDRTAVQQLTDALMQEIDRRTRGSGNFVTWTSGGKA